MKPTFPAEAAGQPVIHEQALVGISDEGDAAVVQLIDAEGAEPQLALLAFDRNGGPTASLRKAPGAAARAVTQRVRQAGLRLTPVLATAASSEWPEAATAAAELGYPPRSPAIPQPGRRRWELSGAPQIGSLPLALRVGEAAGEPRAMVLLLSEIAAGGSSDSEVEVARIPLAGSAISSELWIQKGTAWL